MKVVFIGALPFRTNEDAVRRWVEPYGLHGAIEIHADWVHPTFEPYALVTLRDAERAVNELDGKKIGPNHLRVHEWRAHGER